MQGLAAVGRAKTRLLGVLGTSVTTATHPPRPRTDLGLSFRPGLLEHPLLLGLGPPPQLPVQYSPGGCRCTGQVPCCGLELVSPGGTDPHPAAHRLCHDAFSENMAGEAQLLERRRLYHCAAYTCAIALVRCVFTELRFYQGFLFSEKPEKVGPSRPLAVLYGSRGVGLGVLLGPAPFPPPGNLPNPRTAHVSGTFLAPVETPLCVNLHTPHRGKGSLILSVGC